MPGERWRLKSQEVVHATNGVKLFRRESGHKTGNVDLALKIKGLKGKYRTLVHADIRVLSLN